MEFGIKISLYFLSNQIGLGQVVGPMAAGNESSVGWITVIQAGASHHSETPRAVDMPHAPARWPYSHAQSATRPIPTLIACFRANLTRW